MYINKTGLNWVEQLRDVLIQRQGEHLMQHLQKRTLKKEQDLKLTRQKSKTYNL